MKVLPFEIQATNTLVYKAGTSHKTITHAGLCATSLLELDQDWGPAGPVSSPREPRKVRLARALLSIPHLLPQGSFRCHLLDLWTNISLLLIPPSLTSHLHELNDTLKGISQVNQILVFPVSLHYSFNNYHALSKWIYFPNHDLILYTHYSLWNWPVKDTMCHCPTEGILMTSAKQKDTPSSNTSLPPVEKHH